MNITTRHLQGEEMLETIYTLNSYSLHTSPPYQNKEEWMKIVREREGMNCHAVFDDDVPVSVTRTLGWLTWLTRRSRWHGAASCKKRTAPWVPSCSMLRWTFQLQLGYIQVCGGYLQRSMS